MNPKVDEFICKSKKWQEEIKQLRTILLDCLLIEDFKWRNPCYTFQEKNIVLIGVFKEFITLSFFKGVLLLDIENVLVSPGENSQSVKMFKFTSIQEIINQKAIIQAFIFEAIAIEKAGLKVVLKDNSELELVSELVEVLSKNATLKKAFDALTPGRQRAYNIYFSGAKQSATRVSRIESYTDRILKGKGINDCVCGMSKRMPSCDGSHKYI